MPPHRRPSRQPVPGGVDSLENVARGRLARHHGQSDARGAAPLRRAHALRTVHAAAHAGDLGVGEPQQRVVRAGVHPNPAGGSPAETARHEPLGLPRLHPTQLLGKARLVGCGDVRLPGQDSGRLVVPVPAAVANDKHVGAKAPDGPDHVSQDRLAPPFLEGLLGGLRKPKIDRPREVLLAAVDPARRQQFLRADQAQQFALLRSDEILAAVAARQGKIGGPNLAATGKIRQHRRILVVRMGADRQNTAQDIQPLQCEFGLTGSRQVPLGRGRNLNQAQDESGARPAAALVQTRESHSFTLARRP